MRHRILQHGRLLPALEARLAERYALHPLWSESDPQGFLAAHGGEFEGLVTSARFGADAALIAAMPALKIISSFRRRPRCHGAAAGGEPGGLLRGATARQRCCGLIYAAMVK